MSTGRLVGHGLAHFFIAHKFENATAEWMAQSPFQRNFTAKDRMQYYVFLFAFWWGFMRGCTLIWPRSKAVTVLCLLASPFLLSLLSCHYNS